MSPAERDAIRAAAREVAKDAPPLGDEVLAMLRADQFPVVAKRADRGAA